MTRLAILGAELGHQLPENMTVSGSTFSYDTTVKRSGTRSYKFTGTTICVAAIDFTQTAGATLYLSCAIYVPSATGGPTNGPRIMAIENVSSSVMMSARLNSDASVSLMNFAGSGVGSASAALALDTWHLIELSHTPGTGAGELRVNGVSIASGSSGFNTVDAGGLRFGWIDAPGASAETFYIDDICVNDSAGSVNNSWVGPEKVVALLPVSTNRRDASWTDGAGAVTNIHLSVDNIPPVGEATTGTTGGSQIENAISDSTQVYAANMTTYTAAGLGANDTVTAVEAIAVGGTSSTSGTNTLEVLVNGNPIGSGRSFDIDLAVAAAFPTGWYRGSGSILEMPTVVMGNAPVVQVRKETAATRTHAVCLMALVVSYLVYVPPIAMRRRLGIIS